MRIVNENGKHFTHKNYFMMLKELDYTLIDANSAKFLHIMKDELGITDLQLEDFLRTMKIEEYEEKIVKSSS